MVTLLEGKAQQKYIITKVALEKWLPLLTLLKVAAV